MASSRELLNSRPFIWAILAIPSIFLLIAALTAVASDSEMRPAGGQELPGPGGLPIGGPSGQTAGDISPQPPHIDYGGLSGQEIMEIRNPAGTFAAILVALALIMTPLRQVWNTAFVRWLIARRRYFGVAAFCYAVVHLAGYLAILESGARFFQELGAVEVVLGWLSFLIMAALALTSNQLSTRLLGRHWKQVQRAAYVLGAVVLFHWVIAHGPVPAVVIFAPVALLESLRVWRYWRNNRRPVFPPLTAD